jgi:signal transduction histidine kinase
MSSFFEMTSLQDKITGTYLVLAIVTALLGVFAISDLLFLERQIAHGRVVTDLKDAVLEMRREEKNLFLYDDPAAYARADEHAALSSFILQRHQPTLEAILPEQYPLTMDRHILSYRNELANWRNAVVEDRKALQERLLDLGHRIYLSAEQLAGQERRMLESVARETQWFLFLSLLLIGTSIYLVGRQLKRIALIPLKQLESSLEPIAKGRFNQLQPPSSDREFVTFTDAFNRMLKELEVRQKQLLHSEKLASLGILAAGVAHELNNPLSNISTSCQLLMEELTQAQPGQLDGWLRQIDSETERGRRIVRTLLDFGGQRVFQKHTHRLLDLINETRLIIGKTLTQQAADLSINVPEELAIRVDKQRFQQLFINLIHNALQAGGPGVQVRISAMSRDRGAELLPKNAQVAGDLKCIIDAGGRFVEILISDNGPGIPEENLPRIFDPFFTTSEPGHGTGLGLFIAQEIVKEHDGCLAISAHPQRGGTQVIILLPEGETGSD